MLNPLNKTSHVPMYLQLTYQFNKLIDQGKLKPGDKIPSERELSETLNISRITARLAIQELLKSGLVYREQGRGTFVAEAKMNTVQGFTSFTEEIIKRGMKPGSFILAQEVVPADEETAKSLRLEPGDPVIYLSRVRLANERPIAVQNHYIPQRLLPDLEKEELTNQSLFELLRKKYFISPAWTEAAAEATKASPEEAKLLHLKAGEPVLVIHGLTFTESFEVIESVHTTYPGKGLSVYIGRQRIGNQK